MVKFYLLCSIEVECELFVEFFESSVGGYEFILVVEDDEVVWEVVVVLL